MDDKKGNDKIVDDIALVASHVGKSRRTVFRWVKKGMPTLPDGRFDLDQIDLWLQKRNGIGEPAVQASTEDGKDFWDKENKKHQAKLRELEYRKRKRELIERRQIDDLLVGRVQAVKAGLLALERSLPPELIACKTEREMSSVIRRHVRGLLERYSKPITPEDLN